MRRPLRIALFVLGGILVAILVALLVLYRAAQHVPSFYQEVLEADRGGLGKESDRMVHQAIQLQNELHGEGQWQAEFTADEINGWLAVEMPKNHRDLLPPELSEPRVKVEPGRLTLACRADKGKFHGVVSLAVDAYLEPPDVLVLRIRKARVGAIPWPLDQVLKGISEAARRSDLRVKWRQAEGDPVALISLPPIKGEHGRTIQIDGLRLEDGVIKVTGTTTRRK